MWSVPISAAANAAEGAAAVEAGQGALALLVLIALVAGWLGLREAVRRWRAPRA